MAVINQAGWARRKDIVERHRRTPASRNVERTREARISIDLPADPPLVALVWPPDPSVVRSWRSRRAEQGWDRISTQPLELVQLALWVGLHWLIGGHEVEKPRRKGSSTSDPCWHIYATDTYYGTCDAVPLDRRPGKHLLCRLLEPRGDGLQPTLTAALRAAGVQAKGRGHYLLTAGQVQDLQDWINALEATGVRVPDGIPHPRLSLGLDPETEHLEHVVRGKIACPSPEHRDSDPSCVPYADHPGAGALYCFGGCGMVGEWRDPAAPDWSLRLDYSQQRQRVGKVPSEILIRLRRVAPTTQPDAPTLTERLAARAQEAAQAHPTICILPSLVLGVEGCISDTGLPEGPDLSEGDGDCVGDEAAKRLVLSGEPSRWAGAGEVGVREGRTWHPARGQQQVNAIRRRAIAGMATTQVVTSVREGDPDPTVVEIRPYGVWTFKKREELSWDRHKRQWRVQPRDARESYAQSMHHIGVLRYHDKRVKNGYAGARAAYDEAVRLRDLHLPELARPASPDLPDQFIGVSYMKHKDLHEFSRKSAPLCKFGAPTGRQPVCSTMIPVDLDGLTIPAGPAPDPWESVEEMQARLQREATGGRGPDGQHYRHGDRIAEAAGRAWFAALASGYEGLFTGRGWVTRTSRGGIQATAELTVPRWAPKDAWQRGGALVALAQHVAGALLQELHARGCSGGAVDESVFEASRLLRLPGWRIDKAGDLWACRLIVDGWRAGP